MEALGASNDGGIRKLFPNMREYTEKELALENADELKNELIGLQERIIEIRMVLDQRTEL